MRVAETDLRSHLKKRFGISIEIYRSIFKEQRERCGICRTPILLIAIKGDAGMKGRAHVDHCHKTGRIRGLLCSRCNLGIGLFLDSSDRLRRAVAYLRSHT